MSIFLIYVVPVEKCNDLAVTLKGTSNVNDIVLKWLIEFSTSTSPKFKYG